MVQIPAGLAAFYRGEYARVLGALSLYLGDNAVAEELTQEAFVRACQHWEKVEAMRAPGAWVHRVAMNLANSKLRRRYTERRATQRIGHESATPSPIDTADTLAIREALSELPRDERAVVVLRFYAGLSVAETAEALGRPTGTIKTWTRRALERLRRSGLVEREVIDER